jgi:G3E family GTPase
MKIHLLGGFLGAGKTTAIIGAAKLLMSRGNTVGIITNDQGKYLVDTAFFRLADLPTVEVTGGCFCCNYGEFDEQIDALVETVQPDVIFAESVGSCADLVATVIRPLHEFRADSEVPTTYSVIVDGRLLQLFLAGEDLPFSDNVSYIFEKQIEESALLVINKIDLLPAGDAARLITAAQQAYPGKGILAQNSLHEDSIAAWLDILETMDSVPAHTLELDYDRYGAGEGDLAWLDERLHFSGAAERGREFVISLVSDLERRIRGQKFPIGHLKIEVTAGTAHAKISFTALETPGWEQAVPLFPPGKTITMLINGRVQCPADTLQRLVETTVSETAGAYGVFLVEEALDAFNPGFPNPTHRMAGSR